MFAHDVPDFVAEYNFDLGRVGDLDQARVEDDERIVHADGAGVDDGRLRYEQGRYVVVENLTCADERFVDVGILVGPDLHGGRLKHRVDVLLPEDADNLLQKRVEACDLLKSTERGPVGRVFP